MRILTVRRHERRKSQRSLTVSDPRFVQESPVFGVAFRREETTPYPTKNTSNKAKTTESGERGPPGSCLVAAVNELTCGYDDRRRIVGWAPASSTLSRNLYGLEIQGMAARCVGLPKEPPDDHQTQMRMYPYIMCTVRKCMALLETRRWGNSGASHTCLGRCCFEPFSHVWKSGNSLRSERSRTIMFRVQLGSLNLAKVPEAYSQRCPPICATHTHKLVERFVPKGSRTKVA